MPRKSKQQGRSHTILVVDDQEETLISTRQLLEREGHRVLTAESGARALTLLKEDVVDLVLVDYFMPRMTGDQLVREIRAFDPFVQIIVQTAYSGDKPPRATLADLDIQGYHDKADGPEKLLLWVDALLKGVQQLRQARPQERRPAPEPSLAPMTFVLVEARGDTSGALTPLLQTEGYRVLTAHGIGDALDIFVAERPQFIVIDDTLLDQSGAELVRRIRTLDPGTAIIAQCDSLAPAQRRRIMRSLGLHGIHDRHDAPDRLLELLDSWREAARRIEQTRAEQSLRGLILAKLCHDLRSCMHVVHGYTEILCGDPAAARFEEVLTRLAAASETGIELVQGYLDLAHLDAPGAMIRRELVSIDELVEDLRAQAERQIGDRPLRFTVSVPCAGAVVHSDGEKLRAILVQLVANALKFSIGGTVEMSVRFAANRTDFVLVDTGAEAKDLERPALLHHPDPTSIEFQNGTPGQALGLAIAMRLSQLLGAVLTADRGEGGGAIFSLSLPATALSETDSALGGTVH